MWHWPNVGSNPTMENALEEYFDSDDFTFADTLVREALQNSLDARLDPDKPVQVVFNFRQAADGSAYQDYFQSLGQYRSETELGNPEDEFAEPRWLVIQDSNTTGLLGELGDRESNFWNYWLNFGRSNKTSGSRGRHGAGRITFLMASQLNAVLGVTRREDGITALCGMAGLRTAMHEGEFRAPMAILGKSPTGNVWNIWTDDEIVEKFIEDFELSPFGQETGFALVVPYPYPGVTPHQLKAAVVEHFAPAILSGELEVGVDGEFITSHTIENVALASKDDVRHPQLRANPVPFLRFLEKSLVATPIEIALETSRRIKNLPENATIPEAKIEEMKAAYETGEAISIILKFPLKKATGSDDTSLKIALQKPDDDDTGIEMYFRQGMSMPDKSMSKLDNRVHGAVMADDEHIADYLNICEGKAHLSWSQTRKIQDRLASEYSAPVIEPRNLAVFCLKDIVELVAEEEHTKDSNLLENFFSVKDEGAKAKDKQKRKKPKPKKEVPPRKPPAFNVGRLNTGFSVKPNPNAESLPDLIRLTLAYADGRRNPQKRWSAIDFNLDCDVQIEAVGCEVTVRENELTIGSLSEEFEVKVTGFDVRRELDVSARSMVNGD